MTHNTDSIILVALLRELYLEGIENGLRPDEAQSYALSEMDYNGIFTVEDPDGKVEIVYGGITDFIFTRRI